MKVKKKILAIIYRRKEGVIQFLALRNNPGDPIHGGDFYYTVTGGIKGGESQEEALKREIREETGIKRIISTENLNKIYEYTCSSEGDYLCQESAFLVEVDADKIRLNNEHIDYKWLDRDEYIQTIWWGDKADLRRFLSVL